MAIYRFQSSMHMTSNIPDDAVVNTWHFTDAVSAAVLADVVTAWATFMDNIKSIFPSTVERTAHVAKIYDLADPEPRAPILTGNWLVATAPTGTPFPAEVALCLSYEGARVSGEAQNRRRGRMYLGPLDTATGDAAGRPTTTVTDLVLAQFQTFLGDMDSANAVFGVYSRADNVLVPIETAWCDNAFDTQRRRGLAPTVRNTLLVQ